jgi:sensor histidine kinase YesM
MTLKRWTIIFLLWQLIGLVVTLIVTIPFGNFHKFVHELIICLTFTNSVAVITGLFIFLHKILFKRINNNTFVRIVYIAAIGLLSLSGLAIAGKFSLDIGKVICGLDSYKVNRWHLFIIMFNLVVMTMISISCILYFLYNKISKNLEIKVRENEKLQRIQIESKLAVLQSKVNPHFLFNTLNTMMEILHQDPNVVEKMIFNLSAIYRKVLTMPDSSLVSLSEELELVQEYLEIEKTRMGIRLDYCIKIDDSLLSFRIPPIIIQILVENAIQHGISPKKEGGMIHINIKKDNDIVSIIVVDNGVGIKRNYDNTGFGIYNIQQRLSLIYSDKAKFDISLLPKGGTQVKIELPYET